MELDCSSVLEMKYNKEYIQTIQVGKFVGGYGYLIGNSVFSRKLMITFKDGEKCNADYEDEAIDWMNKIKENDVPLRNIR